MQPTGLSGVFQMLLVINAQGALLKHPLSGPISNSLDRILQVRNLRNCKFTKHLGECYHEKFYELLW